MDAIINSIMQQLNQISVSGLDVERMYIAKHQLRQLHDMLTVPKKEEKPDVHDQINVPVSL